MAFPGKSGKPAGLYKSPMERQRALSTGGVGPNARVQTCGFNRGRFPIFLSRNKFLGKSAHHTGFDGQCIYHEENETKGSKV